MTYHPVDQFIGYDDDDDDDDDDTANQFIIDHRL